NLDQLACEGRRFTNFHVSQPVCSASRASLLTGCYANRIGIHGAMDSRSKIGISDREMTLAQLLKQRNYKTAIFGKWHLGHHRRFLPTRHGFDEYFGLPYSNDMWPASLWIHPDLPMLEGERVAIPALTAQDQEEMTTWYTERAVKFIQRNKHKPFFLY